MSELRSSERASHEAPRLNPIQPQVPQPTSMDRNVFFAFRAYRESLLLRRSSVDAVREKDVGDTCKGGPPTEK